jgi:hypothetical protein
VLTNRRPSHTAYSSARDSQSTVDGVFAPWDAAATGRRIFAARQRGERFSEGSLLIKRDRAGRLPSKTL